MTKIAGALLTAIAAAAFSAGCGRNQAGPGAYNPPPPEVGVVTLAPEPVALTTELPGRIDPVRVAQVRARVDGIVLHRNFREGADVTNGEVLYEIDPAPYKAALDSANASLTQAQQLVERYEPLVGINAVSKQDYDNAVSAAAQAKAAQEIAAVNFGYCTVTAPISGQIGAALVTEGALVSQSAATEMALVTQLDPIYCDFTESSTEVLRLRRELENGTLKSAAPGEAKVTLLLDDGTTYPQPGKLLFSDITVDPTSGMVTLRAEFPNPEHLLLPGMFARGELEQAVDSPGHHRSPARRQRRRERHRHRDGGGRGRQGGSQGDQNRPGGGQQMDRHGRIESGRAGHRRRIAKSSTGDGGETRSIQSSRAAAPLRRLRPREINRTSPCRNFS